MYNRILGLCDNSMCYKSYLKPSGFKRFSTLLLIRIIIKAYSLELSVIKCIFDWIIKLDGMQRKRHETMKILLAN